MRFGSFTKTYNGNLALTMPSMELNPGSIYAVIGANGSGKSTLAKALAGIIPVDGGKTVLDKRTRTGYLPQRAFAFRLSTLSNIMLTGGDPQRAKELMKTLQIDHLASRRGSRLSGGETARMALARIMMQPYDLLILDEPTASMDMESTALAEQLFLRYCSDIQCVGILVTHDLQQARRTADQVLFLQRGELIESGPAQQVLYEPKMEKTRKFLDFYGLSSM